MSYRIRVGQEKDLKRLTEIYNMSIEEGGITAYTETFNIDERREWLSSFDHKYPLFVIEEDGFVLGYSYLSPYRPGRRALSSVVEISYYLDLNYIGRGIGSTLIEHTINISKELGYLTMVAILLSSNIRSIFILEKFGFSLWGEIPESAQFGENWYSHIYYGRKL